jgi:hypothetical protein
MARTQSARAFFLAGLAGALVLPSGCDPSMYDFRVYDDLADSTWVHSSGSPDGLGRGDYGFAMAGGGQPSGEGARFLVAGRNTDGYGQVRHAADGTVQIEALSVYAVNTLDGPNPLPQPAAMAGDAASSLGAVGLTNGGTVAAPARATVGLIDARAGQTQSLFSLAGGQIIRDMDFGRTDVEGSGARNLALVRGNQLAVIADIANPAGTALPVCTHDRPFGLSVVVADIDSLSPEDEIIFAVSDGVAASAVHVVSGSLVSAAFAAAEPPAITSCFDDDGERQSLITISAPNGELDFGKEMVVADFNGNGIHDLAIGSTERVYVYLDVDVSEGLPTPLILQPPDGPGGFGTALAAGDLTGDGADELVIGAPNTPAKDQPGAGRVYLYQLVGTSFGNPVTLGDAQPEANQVFGRAVAVVPFGDGDRILVVGAKNEIYTYFRTPLSGDVRQFSP